MNGYQPKTKRPKSICVTAFPEQFKQLHPERSAAGGVKARSQSEEVRMAVYRPIAELFKEANPLCQCCGRRGFVKRNLTEHVHHVRGRSGYLLFDVRWFKAACGFCHVWIDAHRGEARKLGLLAAKGEWNNDLK